MTGGRTALVGARTGRIRMVPVSFEAPLQACHTKIISAKVGRRFGPCL